MFYARRSLLALTTATLVGVWLVAAKVSSDPQPAKSKSAANVFSTPRASAPANSSDAALAREIDRRINESDSAHARWGVFIVSMKDSRAVYSRDGDKLFTPASNMKIFTTAVALDLLGTDYRWRTSVYAARSIDAGGVVEGDLTLYGRGAPDLGSKRKEGLPALVDQLYQRGVRRVRGDIVGDQSHFRAEMYAVGWQWNDLQWYYGAEPSALTIDENSVEVTISPGQKSGTSASLVVTPNDNYVRLTNSTSTAERGAVTSIGIHRALSANDVRIWGEFPVGGRSFSAFLSVNDPALHAATILKRLLIARGIQVEGEARSRDFRVAESEQFDPLKAVELAYLESAPLSEIVRKTNKESNNLYAELILRTLGKERGATVPDPDPRKNATRGDDVAGGAIIRKWLNDKGINTDRLALHDGSGLSRLDLITPESATRLLAVAANASWGKTFHDSLPIAGRDGTLRGRLKNVSDRVFAKTGTLTYHHSLSGYAATASGEVVAFSIFCNDAAGPSHPVRVIDSIVSQIVGYGPGSSEKTP